MSILKLENISYHYDKSKVMVLDKLNMDFDEGKIYTIVGKSGAGKTTLLSVLSSLAAPTDGEIFLNDKDITKIDRYKFRSKYVGVIFQSFNLLTHLTALENVILSMDISGKKFDRPKKEIALELLKKVGLDEEEAKRRVLKLSGGQQQRVAIARALSYDPDIILADEPTGNLDGETQDEIIGIFRMLAEEGKCVIIVTHSPDVAKASDITYELKKPDKAS
jgi:putative ABC transport system ATP-binding protein